MDDVDHAIEMLKDAAAGYAPYQVQNMLRRVESSVKEYFETDISRHWAAIDKIDATWDVRACTELARLIREAHLQVLVQDLNAARRCRDVDVYDRAALDLNVALEDWMATRLYQSAADARKPGAIRELAHVLTGLPDLDYVEDVRLAHSQQSATYCLVVTVSNAEDTDIAVRGIKGYMDGVFGGPNAGPMRSVEIQEDLEEAW